MSFESDSKLFKVAAKPEDLEQQFPGHMPVAVSRVVKADTMVQLVGDAEAYLFHSDDKLGSEAKQQSAFLFEYLYDLGDVWRDTSFTQRLTYMQDIDNLLRDIEQAGAVIYQGSRSTKMVGQNWNDKTPMSINIAYLLTATNDSEIKQMMVPKRQLA